MYEIQHTSHHTYQFFFLSMSTMYKISATKHSRTQELKIDKLLYLKLMNDKVSLAKSKIFLVFYE